MRYPATNLIGLKFHWLTVTEKTSLRDNDGGVIWNCKCICGKDVQASTAHLRANDVVSCGCKKSKQGKFRYESKQVPLSHTDEKKFCPICKTWFPRPKGKSNKVWEKQVCCGKDCSAISRRKPDTKKVNIPRRKELIPGNRQFGGC